MSLGIPLTVEVRRCPHCNTLVEQQQRREYTHIDGDLHFFFRWLPEPHRGPCGRQCRGAYVTSDWKREDGTCAGSQCEGCAELKAQDPLSEFWEGWL